MDRRRKDISQTFYDFFADMEPDEQAIALRIMHEIHRQSQRQAKPKTVEQPDLPMEAAP